MDNQNGKNNRNNRNLLGWEPPTPPRISDPQRKAQLDRQVEQLRQALLNKRERPASAKPAQEIDPALLADWRNGPSPRHIIRTSKESWLTFDFERHPDLLTARGIIARWYNDHLPRGAALILAGNTGCGKSRLAQALREMYGPMKVCYLNELELINDIQAGYGGKGGKTLEEISMMSWHADWLVLDDFGAYPTENLPWIQGIYYTLFDRKYENRKGILLTTNLHLTVFNPSGDLYSPLGDRLGPRCSSRIMGQLTGITGDLSYYIDLFNVPDYRIKALG